MRQLVTTSLVVNDDGTRFIMNPNQRHFSRIKASDIIELDANEPASSTAPMRQTLRLGVCTEVFIGAAPMLVCDACAFKLRHGAGIACGQ